MSNITINSLPTASTIDATQDILPIYTASGAATQGINRNTLLGLSSAPVGLTDSQTLTNKILTSPTINGSTLSGTLSGTYTIGGTPTFPSSVVTLTGSQTLTNKVLTSPTINSPTITNATISADAITGFSTSNTGSIYGISITAGQFGSISLSGTATVAGLLTGSGGFTLSGGTLTLPNNSIVAANLSTSAIKIGYTQITSNFTTTSATFVDVTSLAVTFTMPAGGRDVRVTVHADYLQQAAATNTTIAIVEGSTVLGGFLTGSSVSGNWPVNLTARVSAPSAGSHTYKVQMATTGGTTATIEAGTAMTTPGGSAGPAFIMVEAI